MKHVPVKLYLSSDVKLGHKAVKRIEKGLREWGAVELVTVECPPGYYVNDHDWRRIQALDPDKHGTARISWGHFFPLASEVKAAEALIEREIRLLRDPPKAQRILKMRRVLEFKHNNEAPKRWMLCFTDSLDGAEELFYMLKNRAERRLIPQPTLTKVKSQ